MYKKVFHIVVYVFAAVGFFLTAGFFAVKYGFTNTKGVIDEQREGFLAPKSDAEIEWNKGEEWDTLRAALKKDEVVINRVSKETGVPSRKIVSVVVVEQLRLFYSERETFKQVFAPLKILGTQSQFSWGVAGIKPDTAKAVEENLKNPNSSYYLGKNYENMLDFKTENPDEERYARLTDYKNRYYSYLYTALYLKQIETSWKKAGFPIDEKVGVLATLYNIGFARSIPKENPSIGGAEIKIGASSYSFGGLAEEFYKSGELLDTFPRF